MPTSNNLIPIQISKVKVGTFIVNLGEILEIEENGHYFHLVISRMNEKQVIKFDRDISLWTRSE